MTQIVEFNPANLPAHLAQAGALAASVNQAAATGTGGSTVDHISIKGGRFHIVRSGQPAQTLETFSLKVIIVHGNPGMTKAFFKGKWNPDADSEAPICASDDGIAPRADSSEIQCASCAACPQNQFGSAINPQTGAEGKACADKKTIAVVTPGRADGLMLRLQVPAASLKEYGNFLKALPNVPYYGVITEIRFDTTVSYPRLLFKPVDYVSAADFAIVERLHKEDKSKSIAGVAGFNGSIIPTTSLPSTPPAHLAGPTPEQLAAKAAQEQAALLAQQQAAAAQAQQQAAALAAQQQAAALAEQQRQQAAQAAAAAQVAQPAADPIAAILGGQFGDVVATQPQAEVQQAVAAPAGRVPGQPSPGKKRRTKAEMAEDAAMGIGKAAGETSEEDDVVATQAQQTAQVQQPAADVGGFGEAVQDAGGFGEPVATQAQTYVQPADKPQVVTGDTANAFEGWDD